MADTTAADAAAAADAIRGRAAAIRDRELETAIARLEAAGDLTPAQRVAVEAMATRLTAALLGPPTTALEGADPHVARAAHRVFAPD